MVFYFQDSFEDCAFIKWTSTGTGGTPAVLTCTNVHPPPAVHLDYYAKCSNLINVGDKCSMNKDLPSSYSEIYFRVFWRLETALAMANTGEFQIMVIPTIAQIRISKEGGNFYLKLWWHGATWLSVKTLFTPAADQWYCIELYYKIHATLGAANVWVDNVPKLSINNKDTDNYGLIKKIKLEAKVITKAQTAARIAYYDCVEVASARLYCDCTCPEEEEGNPTFWNILPLAKVKGMI